MIELSQVNIKMNINRRIGIGAEIGIDFYHLVAMSSEFFMYLSPEENDLLLFIMKNRCSILQFLLPLLLLSL